MKLKLYPTSSHAFLSKGKVESPKLQVVTQLFYNAKIKLYTINSHTTLLKGGAKTLYYSTTGSHTTLLEGEVEALYYK